jgi:phage terminase large subunit-like protein
MENLSASPTRAASLSEASSFLRLPKEIREQRIAALSDAEIDALRFDWEFWGRQDQFIPKSPWVSWLVMAGRGFGKTRTGAETVRKWVRRYKYVNLIGATSDDARDIMSGVLSICPRDERPIYVTSKRRLEWPNGARSLIFTADEPERLRGKQHMKFWGDELGSWRYQEAWDQASLGLRLGDNPQCVITTTPRPLKTIRDLILDPTTIVTTGTTYDNSANLAPAFLSKIISRYENTRLGRQELYAELLDDTPGALWTRIGIDKARVQKLTVEIIRIVVAIDPAGSTAEGSDETGIVVAGKGVDGRWYVLEDLSGKYSPDQWGEVAVEAYKRWKADRIVGEVNNGGDMVEAIVRSKDANCSYKGVHATRGKAVRAEPVAALYEQGRVSHVGYLGALEDQMCIFTTDYDRVKMKFSPDRMDALVWALNELAIEQSPGDNLLEYWKQRDAEEMAKKNALVQARV